MDLGPRPGIADALDRIMKLTGAMMHLDRLETTAHQKTKRADLIRSLKTIPEEFSTTVSAIISGEPE